MSIELLIFYEKKSKFKEHNTVSLIITKASLSYLTIKGSYYIVRI